MRVFEEAQEGKCFWRADATDAKSTRSLKCLQNLFKRTRFHPDTYATLLNPVFPGAGSRGYPPPPP